MSQTSPALKPGKPKSPASKLASPKQSPTKQALRPQPLDAVSQLSTSPADLTAAEILTLQRTLGNRTTRRLLPNQATSAQPIALSSTPDTLQRVDDPADYPDVYQQIRTYKNKWLVTQKWKNNKVLEYLQSYPNMAAEIEVAYDNLFAPQKFGDLISGYFVKYLQNDDGTFDDLVNLYPNYTGRIKAAYRQAKGEQKASAAVDEAPTRTATALDGPGQQAKDDFLGSGPFTVNDFVTSIGGGKFDAEYDPAASLLKIKMRLFYTFDDNNLFEIGGDLTSKKLTRDQRAAFGGADWTDDQRDEFVANFEENIISTWSNQYILTCQKPGWEDVFAKPVVELERVADRGQAHFEVKTNKGTVVDKTDFSGQSKTELKAGQGASSVDTDNGVARLKQFDVNDKLNDPLVHKYLHKQQEDQIVTNAYQVDRERLESMLAGTAVRFDPNSADTILAADAGKVAEIKDTLEKLGLPSALAHLHPIVLKGSTAAGESDELGMRRAWQLQLLLKQAGVQQSIETARGAADAAKVDIEAGPLSDDIKAKFVDNWSRVSAAHEFGHMLGLTDEYNPATTSELVQKMIDSGLLPPNTPTNHFGASAQSKGSFNAKHTEMAGMLDEAGVDAPIFGNPDTERQQEQSTSLMSGGFEVLKAHYITMWEALAQLTQPTLGRTDWKIE